MPDRKGKTRKDDLHTGAPFWVRTPHSTVKPETRLPDGRFDAIVVGAGISGALLAEALTRAGKSVLMVDRRPPVRGSTAASTAMIQHEIDVPLRLLRNQIGKASADAVWRRSARAVKDLVALVHRLDIACSMEPKSTLYIAGNTLSGRPLAREKEVRAEIGLHADHLDRQELKRHFGMDRDGAILSQPSASANPAQLTAGLIRVVLEHGGRLVSPVEITDVAEMPGGVALSTRDGKVLVAEHAIFCTGYEYLHRMEARSHRVTSTWALASEPLSGLPGWLDDTIVWESSEPYLYFRADGKGRIIAGGEDEQTPQANDDPERLDRKGRVIAEKLKRLSGIDIGKPAYIWSAPFGVTADGMPIIDRVPGFERVYAVMGFGGNGITFSMIAAQIIASDIAGKPDADASLFKYR